VHHVVGVGLGEPVGHLHRQVEGPGRLQGRLGEKSGEGLALHQLHGDEGGTLGIVDLVDHRDRRVHQPGGGTGLAPEPTLGLGVAGGGRAQDLERHLPPETGVEGAVDDPHPPPPQLVEDLVLCQLSTDHFGSSERILDRKARHPPATTVASPIPGFRKNLSSRKLWVEAAR
jgi:hypothetical protein